MLLEAVGWKRLPLMTALGPPLFSVTNAQRNCSGKVTSRGGSSWPSAELLSTEGVTMTVEFFFPSVQRLALYPNSPASACANLKTMNSIAQ